MSKTKSFLPMALGVVGVIIIATIAIVLIMQQRQDNEKKDDADTITQAEFKPLKLEYTAGNLGPLSGATATYWLDQRATCDGREAYQGIMKISSAQEEVEGMIAKITVYADNGEMATSNFDKDEEALVFDDAVSYLNEFNLLLTVNSLFAYAGDNFNTSSVWDTTTPVALSDVDSGTSVSDYSLIKQDETTVGDVSCQQFKIVAKGTNVDGYFTGCVSRELGISLPFIVSFAFENEQGPHWELTAHASESSGITYLPQCLEPIRCIYVAQPAEDVRTQCETSGGQQEQIRDEHGCTTEYRCVSGEEYATERIRQYQNPACDVNEAVKNELVQCQQDGKPNFDGLYNEHGCIYDIECRE
jgi:hypothetical protein